MRVDPATSERTDDLARLTPADLIALGAAGFVAVIGYSSLQLADLHHARLSLVLGLSAVLGVALVAVAVRFGGLRPTVIRDRAGTVVLGLSGLVAAGLTMPGFADGAASQDPGVYVAEGVQIAHSHSYSFTDIALATHGLPVQVVSPGAAFSGVWIRDRASGLIIPQFSHLQPALLSVGYDVGHFFGLELVTPLCGLIGVLLLVALLRRLGTALHPAAGLPAAVIGGLLFSVNELQTWQSRSPSSEALAQLLWLGALLALVVAAQTSWRPAAGLAGLFVGIGFLDRADGILGLLLFAGLGAVLVVVGRVDGRFWWGLTGVALVLPLGLWQAYAGAVVYTRVNNVPSLLRLALAVLALFLVAFALRLVGPRLVTACAPESRRRALGVGFAAVVFVLLAAGFLRPHLQANIYHYTGKGQLERTFDEFNVKRFGFYVGLPVLGLAAVGVLLVGVRRWSAALWIFVLGTLAQSVVYLYASRNSPQLMFWARRYVPAVLPGFIALAALALAFAWVFRSRFSALGRALCAVVVIGTAVWSLVSTVGVRAENEYGGSFAAAGRIASVSPPSGVFLWELDGSSPRSADRMLAADVYLERSRLSVGLPRRTSPMRVSYVRSYARRFGAGQVFVVTVGTARPGELGGFGLTRMLHETGPIRARVETILTKPTVVAVVPIDVTVWRVDSAPAA